MQYYSINKIVMNESDGFITPPEHLKFLAKKLFGKELQVFRGGVKSI